MPAEIQDYTFPVHIDLAQENHFEFSLLDESRNYKRADGRDLLSNTIPELFKINNFVTHLNWNQFQTLIYIVYYYYLVFGLVFHLCDVHRT